MGTKSKARPRRAATAKRVALYLRVSTSDQTTANQRRELQAVAKRHGWAVVHVFEDAGISALKAATSGRRSTPCSRRSRAARSTWWPPGPSIGLAGR